MKVINRLYGKDVELVFDTMKHQYSVNGEIIPGCTSILGIVAKNALMFWSANCASDYFKSKIEPGKIYDEVYLDDVYRNAKKAHTQIKEDAASVGKITHLWVQHYIEGKDLGQPINDKVKGSVERFLKWQKEKNVKFLISEQPCFSRKYKYAGTLDFICKINNKLYIGDLKTNNSMYYNSMGSQCASYIMAREEEFKNEKYAGFVVCRVGKEDGEFESWICEDTKIFKKNFLNALSLYKSEETIKQQYK